MHFKENRLLHVTLADFNQTTKTSTRGIQVPIAPTQQTYTAPASPTPAPKPLPQEDTGYNLQGAGNPVYDTPEQLSQSFTSQDTRKATLDAQLANGEIKQEDYNREISQFFTQEQFDAAHQRLTQGFGGVDPLGFGNTTIQNRGNYQTIDEAQAAADAEYAKTGSISPETAAAVASFKNPVVMKGSTYKPTNRTLLAQQNADTKGKAAKDAALALAKKDAATRMKEAGLDERVQALFSAIAKGGYAGTGNNNGHLVLNSVSPELKKLLIDQNIHFDENVGQDGKSSNITLGMDAEEFNALFAKYQDIAGGKDIETAFGSAMAPAVVPSTPSTALPVAPTIAAATSSIPTPSAAMPSITETSSVISNFLKNSMGTSPEIFNAFLPTLTLLDSRIKSLQTQAETIDTPQERSALAEGMIAPEKALAATRERQLTARNAKDNTLLQESRDILLEANTQAKDALEIDRRITVERQRIGEVQQMAKNVEGEKALRRQLNSLGIENSPNSQNYLQGKIQEAADALHSMITTDNLTLLKFSGARDQLNNGLRSILNDFDSKRASLNANFDDNIFNLDQFVSGARSGVLKDLKADWQKLTEKEDELMMETGKQIQTMTLESMKVQEQAQKDSKKDMMSTKDKLGFVSTERSGINQNKVITQAKDVDGFYGAVNAGYDEYLGLLKDIQSGKVKAGDVSLNASQSAVVSSFARLLDPNSTVRNEEFERQVLGQSAGNQIKGWWEKLTAGGAGLTIADISSIKSLADKLHTSWEDKLSTEMQPFILDIQDWNNSYPDAKIDFAQVIPVDRIHLPKATVNTWGEQAGWSEPSPAPTFTTKGAPEKGWRTDRNNNPLAFAVKAGETNEFTDALDRNGIAWEHGDLFPPDPKTGKQSDMTTVRILGNPVEASRVVLSESGALQNWYMGEKRPYHKNLLKFGIRTADDFKNLPTATQNEVIATIYKGEVGNGSLLASLPAADNNWFVPTAHAADISFQDVGVDDLGKPQPKTSLKLQANMGTSGIGTLLGSSSTFISPQETKDSFGYKTKDGGIVYVSGLKKAEYDKRPDLFTPLS